MAAWLLILQGFFLKFTSSVDDFYKEENYKCHQLVIMTSTEDTLI